MATASTAQRAVTSKDPVWAWEGKDKTGRKVSGEMRAPSDTVVAAALRRQGVSTSKIKKQRAGMRKRITEKDVTFFTRQLATMMKAGVPMLQAFDIVARGHANPSVARLLLDIRGEIESGQSLSASFRKHPKYFDAMFCNLVAAGEAAGILEQVLDSLATYKEKMLALKSKIKSALFYPTAVIGVAIIITAVIMIFVIPAFKNVFTSFGADLPAPTLVVIAMSDFTVEYWYIIFGILGAAIFAFIHAKKNIPAFAQGLDRFSLKAPIFGDLIRKAVIARWTRTLGTMFAAGVPLVDALDSVAGAAGNHVYKVATQRIRQEVSTGTSLTASMNNSGVFPNMVTQMVSIGEESGALDAMLGKVADFFEREVDDAVEALSSLMEPLIMVVLGALIGGMVVAMYLPIFKLGQVV